MAQRLRKRPLEHEYIRKLIKSVADINNTTTEKVEHILWTQFKLVKSVIEEGEMRSILLPNFGKFWANIKLKNYIDEKYIKKHGFKKELLKKPIPELAKRRRGRPVKNTNTDVKSKT